MNLRPRTREELDINLAPFIDVVFLLLIFFMVSTTFLKEGNLELALPEASPSPVQTRQEAVELVIDADGNYSLEGRPLANRQPQTVRRAFEQVASESGQVRPLIVRADAKTPHQAVVTALDAAGQAGIKQIGIATVPDEEKH